MPSVQTEIEVKGLLQDSWEEFESNWFKHPQLKLVDRKDESVSTNIHTGEVPT